MTTMAITSNEFVAGRQRLRRYVDRALARLRAQEALRSVSVVANLSAWLLVLSIFAERLFSLDKLGINIWIIWGALTALGIPYIIWRTYSPHIHENLAAVLADDRLRLHARLSSALTLDFSDPANQAFGEAFFEEALSKLNKLKVEQAFPVAVPRSMGYAFAPLGIAALLFYFMPSQDVLGIVADQAKKRQAEIIQKKVANGLESKLEDMKNKRPDVPVDEHSGQFKVNQLMQKADSIAKEMKNGERTTDEALVALGQLKRDIEAEKEKLGQGKDFLDRLEKLSAKDLNLEESALTKEVSEALKQGDPAQAARQMRKLAQKIKDDILDDPNKTDEQKKQELDKLKREVEKLSEALNSDEELSKGLRDISQTMSQSDYQKFQDEINKFEDKEKKNKGKNKDDAKKKLGDDLEKEMNDVADELERLDEDNDQKLDEEDNKEMEQLDNVEENVDDAMEQLDGDDSSDKEGQQGQQGQPGQQGGKTGKMKSKSGKSGGKSGKNGKSMRAKAGQSGQDGKQGQGSQGRQSGGQNQGDGQKGDKPGDGLGGGQGIGHRPYRDGDAEFVSQKAKGQMQAGAITGLSHFRGQGAKGDAPQEFVSAMTAADQERASSLELERIPSDARDTVKDYFRGVKEAAGIPDTAPAPAPNKDK